MVLDDWIFVSLEDLTEKELTLKDYDIHTVYVSYKVNNSDLPLNRKIDAFMFMNVFRSMILDGNFVKSNIRRVNTMVRRVILEEDKPYTLARRKCWGVD